MNTKSIYKTPDGERVVMALYDAVLARWPVPYTELYVPTRHGDTFAIASGDESAPALMLLHGSCSNAVSWIGDVAEFSRCFRVYAVDIPGEPGRGSHNRPAWDSPAYAEWLEDLLDGLKIPKVTLLGLSQGGWTALKFATCCPERVEKLVLLAPGGIMPARLSFLLRAIPLSMMGWWGAERVNGIVIGSQPIAREAVEFMNAIMTHFKARIGVLPMFSDEALKRLTMPTLLLQGELDSVLPAAPIAARLRSLVPHLTLMLLPDTGHALHNVSAQVLPFLVATEAIAG